LAWATLLSSHRAPIQDALQEKTHPLTNQKAKCVLSLSNKPLKPSPPLGKGSLGYYGEGWKGKVTSKEGEEKSAVFWMQLLQSPPVQALLFLPPDLPSNLDSRFDLHIFVDIYLHIWIILHICYGIFAFLYMCKYLQRLRGIRKVGRCSVPHMSKPTDPDFMSNDNSWWYEEQPFEDKDQFWVPSAYFGTFSLNDFWKHCSFTSISNFGIRRSLLFIPLLGQSPVFDLCLRKSYPRRIAWVALVMWPAQIWCVSVSRAAHVKYISRYRWISVDVLLISPDICWRRNRYLRISSDLAYQ